MIVVSSDEMQRTLTINTNSNYDYFPVLQTGYLYSRWGNPTTDATADVIARLEGAKGTVMFASGCAAISTALITFLKSGDHVVRNVSLQLSSWDVIYIYRAFFNEPLNENIFY